MNIHRWAVLSLIGMSLCGCGALPPIPKKPVPAEASQLVGAWVGHTEDSLFWFRVELRPDGRGLCGYIEYENPKVQTVSGWQTKDGHISIPLVANGSNDITKVTGRAHATIMNLTVHGKGWRDNLILRPERTVEGKAKALKTAMEKSGE
jgi:hypothetical protein